MSIDKSKLFSLEGVIIKGYYVDDNFNVYSEKRGPIVQLLGSKSYNDTYYTMNGSSYGKKFLANWLTNQPAFKNWLRELYMAPLTAVPAVDASKDTSIPNRDHAATFMAGVTGKGYMIGTVQGDRIVLAKEPKFHMTEASVTSEMEHLALSTPGISFVSLKVHKIAKGGGVTWK